MKTKINIKRLRSLILILALLALTGVIAMLIVISNPIDGRLRYIYDEDQVISVSQMPENDNAIFEIYTGNGSHKSIYKSMYIFVDELVEKYYLEFKDNFETQNIEKYFDKNSEKIQKELLIEDKEEFVKFVSSLKSLSGDELVLKQYMVIPQSVKEVARGMKYVIAVDYENSERILFQVTLRNAVIEDYSPLKFEATDDTYKDYQPEQKETGVPKNYVSDINSPGKVVK